MKSVVLVQARNPDAYLPAFLAHHLRLCDHIILLDHNSDVDLRTLRQSAVDVYRIAVKTFAKDIFIQYFLGMLELWRSYDFLFILDVDEFLPFTSRSQIERFMWENRNTSVLSMNWRNGYSDSDRPLDGSETLFFTPWRAPTRKLIYNLAKINHILPIEGNHNARYPIFDSTVLQLRPKRRDSGLGLFHLPVLGLSSLLHKIKTSPEKHFRQKLLRSMLEVGIAPDRARSLELTNEDLMTFVANYRSDLAGIREAEFEQIALFNGIEAEIAAQGKRLAACLPIETVETDNETAIISKLRRHRFFHNRRLAQAFGRNADDSFGFTEQTLQRSKFLGRS